VSGRTQTRTPVGPLKDENGEIISDEKEMAEHINEFFCTVFMREDTTNIPDPEDKRPKTKLQKIRVTTSVAEPEPEPPFFPGAGAEAQKGRLWLRLQVYKS